MAFPPQIFISYSVVRIILLPLPHNIKSFSVHTFANLGFWAYFVKFSLDKLIKGPSGLVSMEAYREK